MEQNYTPKPPRICPVCGSAVADNFESCPTCGSPMPGGATQNAGTAQAPFGPGFAPYDIPEGSTIVRDRKEYFEHYLPRQHYNNIIIMALITQLITLFLGVDILLGNANNVPILFIAHAVIVTALGLWLMAKTDLASSVVTLVYTCLFFFISLMAFDTAYWYPIVAAVLAVVAVVKGDQNWKAYQLAPIPLVLISDEEKKRAGKTQRIYRIVAAVLAVILLALGGVMVWQDLEESKLYEGYTVGEVSGNVYTNDFADIVFTAPSDWYIMNEEELEDYNEEYNGYLYDDESYATILYADRGEEEAYEFMSIDVTRHEREAVAEEYFDEIFDYIDGSQDYYNNTADSEKLENVLIGGAEYQVIHTYYSGGDSLPYHEYILVRTLGALTYEIYFYPAFETTYEEFLACFNS